MKKITSPSWVHPKYRTHRRWKRIGFDLHGVVDTNPRIFKLMFRAFMRDGWEVHIVTGAPWEKERETIQGLRLPISHFFSIVDHHVKIGTKMRWDRKGNAHLDPAYWDRTKALYCMEHKVCMHFDDSDIYAFYFKTPYVRYYSRKSKRVAKIHNS